MSRKFEKLTLKVKGLEDKIGAQNRVIQKICPHKETVLDTKREYFYNGQLLGMYCYKVCKLCGNKECISKSEYNALLEQQKIDHAKTVLKNNGYEIKD